MKIHKPESIVTQNKATLNKNMIKNYQFSRIGKDDKSWEKSPSHLFISPRKKMSKLNHDIKISQYNLRGNQSSSNFNSRNVQLANRFQKTHNGNTHKIAADPAMKSTRAFMKWKAELQRYTDVNPVFNRNPPLSVTRPKWFSFTSHSKTRNSPEKEVAKDTVDTKCTQKQLLYSQQRKKRLCEMATTDRISLRKGRAHTSQRNRTELVSKHLKSRSKTRRDRSTGLEHPKVSKCRNAMTARRNLEVYDSSAMFDKFKLNFDRVLLDSVMSRPLSPQASERCALNKKNSKVKFNNVFVF